MTFIPQHYFGNAVFYYIEDGEELTVDSQPTVYPRQLDPRVIRLQVVDTVATGAATFRLPDARQVARGWPSLMLLVDGPLPCNGFILTDAVSSVNYTWTPGQFPVAITIGLADNSTEAGKWAICSKSFTVSPPSLEGRIAGIGDGYVSLDLQLFPERVNAYTPSVNVWVAMPDLSFAIPSTSASWEGLSAATRSMVIKAGAGIYIYDATGTSTVDTLASVSDGSNVAFARLPPTIGISPVVTYHMVFGNVVAGSYSNQLEMYRTDTNALVMQTTPSWKDWDQCTASGAGAKESVSAGWLAVVRDFTPPVAFAVVSSFFFHKRILDTNEGIIDIPTANLFYGHLVELKGDHHHVAGAYRYFASFTYIYVPTSYHQKIDLAVASAWVTRPNTPVPLNSHGAVGFSETNVRSKVYTRGGFAATDMYNHKTFSYDELTQAHVVERDDPAFVYNLRNQMACLGSV
jgi:hypothetical protein